MFSTLAMSIVTPNSRRGVHGMAKRIGGEEEDEVGVVKGNLKYMHVAVISFAYCKISQERERERQNETSS